MTTAADVIVVGAGIVGAACALELAEAKLRVIVVDQEIPGAGATGASMGHIVVMDDSEAQFALTRYSQVLWNESREELPTAVEFERCGTIWVAADEEEFGEVLLKQRYYAERNVSTEVLDSQMVGDAEPALRKPLAGGLYVVEDSVIYPPSAAFFFLERAAALGAKLQFGKAVTAMGGGSVRLSDGSVLEAKYLLNAAGQFAARMTPGIPVKPRKGHLVITDRYSGLVQHQLVELGYLKSAHSISSDSVAFNVQPRQTGQILIGSSRQYDIENGQVEPAIVSAMMKRALEYLPGLANASCIRVWTGFRPATPDALPLIGPWPEDDSLYVATGHEGLGITTSLATAKLIRAQMLGEPTKIAREPYLPTRSMVEFHA
jgi:D-hydroxyproline dehydrogenase subunit beta